MQRALLQYRDEANHELVRGLSASGRTDLIGDGPQCLVPVLPGHHRKRNKRGTPA
ncbi:MAG TPA: DUF3362 domain-containing protein [Methanoregulaceae archaeon]|nr:DUF3362 domain-containing protein [Methanoregulaceae archaeon]